MCDNDRGYAAISVHLVLVRFGVAQKSEHLEVLVRWTLQKTVCSAKTSKLSGQVEDELGQDTNE